MGTRIVSLILAAMFFISTVGFSVYVIWETTSSKDETTDPAPISTTGATNEAVTEGDENLLEGTKLAGFTPTTTRVTSLEITDIVEGEGTVVKAGDTVTVHYTGALVADGTIFQSSKDFGDPVTFGLEGLIQGWQEGIPGMKPGGTRRLVIPAAKAYGDAEQAGIPADSDLVFDIELVGVAE